VIDLGPRGVARCVEEVGMGFCFAPRFHPAMRYAIPVRRELGVPTVFNFLGPLANPARARFQVVGVSDPAMAEKMLGVLVANGATRAMVVYGHDGLDELSTTGPSTVLEVEAPEPGAPPELRSAVVDPVELGLSPSTLDDLRGGDASVNAQAVRRVVGGDKGPHRDVALLNAAAALVVSGRAKTLGDGLELAAAVVDDGRAEAVLDSLVRVSRAAAGMDAQL
jgi:anthranilate phosphoribosyltransferase